MYAIARGADGGLRDAVSALDQLISFKGKNIIEDDVLSIFGLVSKQIIEHLTESILKSDIMKIIDIINDLDNSGKDLQRVTVELIENFRNILVFCYSKKKILMLMLLSLNNQYLRSKLQILTEIEYCKLLII